MEKQPAVYILANKRNGAIYIGVTSDLSVRITQHKENQVDGFSKQNGTHLLVWYGYYDTMAQAIAEEKRLKEWNRAWKIQLIEKTNPYWNDLSDTI
ncbi:MAG: GIY-YIG nuclease family protein [Synergistaceae bacterium]|nr:GIY-YIG nuclease family protein [Synergistaceae bacterium]